eukprot:TRINITY_DN19555_c0_g1_i3.p1 TRINITY_DN19555_c0_g1~~TRINITY_DN19555_c0_g1_i3.p1  ORF type:complete len:250 (+),score=57.22 TRINITY_DN19555_c0_g1_i3:130-879(+)
MEEGIVRKLNVHGMQQLQDGDPRGAKKTLSCALKLTDDSDAEPSLRVRAVTLNNLACAHESTGALHDARRCLYRALAIESECHQCENPAGTWLNLSAVLSRLGMHERALLEAERALAWLQQHAESDQWAHMLPVAFQNLGVELEYLGRFQEALRAFAHGSIAAIQTMGPDHPVTSALEQSSRSATQSLKAAANPNRPRSAARPVRHPSNPRPRPSRPSSACLLYTSDAADEEDSVDLGGRRIIKKKKRC